MQLKVQEMKALKKLISKFEETPFIDYIESEKSKRVYRLKQFKEEKKEQFSQTIHTFQVVDGLSLWEVNRKLKKLMKSGLTKEDIKRGMVKIPLSRKKSNILATPIEIKRIEKTIDELEGFEELRLHFFYHYKPAYIEKKMFGEIERWLEINIQ